MGRRYLKATEVLSRDLLEEVSKALGRRSAYLWIPSGETISRDQRDAYILRLSEEGYTEAEIADRLFISGRLVRKVLRKMRAGALPSRTEGAR